MSISCFCFVFLIFLIIVLFDRVSAMQIFSLSSGGLFGKLLL